MSFLGNVLGAVIGGGLAVLTGGASLAIGAGLGGALGGLASGGGIKGAIQGGLMGYGGGSLLGGAMSGMAAGGAEVGTGAMAGGATAAGASGAINVVETLIQNGVAPSQAIQMANVSPAMAEAAGISAGAGMTWADVATEAGIPFGSPTGAAAPASMGGMVSKLGQGVTPGDMFGLAKANMGTPGGVGGFGAMPWGSPGNLMTMGNSLYGLMESERLKQMAQGLSQQADPFGPYRQQYAQQMSMLSANPSTLVNQPGYQAGLDAVQRSMAAQGYTGSGNMMAALSKYGGDFYNQTMGMYGQLAGANANPAAGAQLNLQGQGLGANLAMNSLGLMGKGVAMAGQ